VTCTWTIPSLPALRDLSIDCEKSTGGSSILIDLTKLPRLSSFELEEYAGEGLTLLGSSSTVKKVHFTVSNIELSFLRNLGQNIEEVDLFSCAIHPEGHHSRVQLPHLRSLSLTNDSITFLPFLFPTNISCLEKVSITTDFDCGYSKLLALLNLEEGTTTELSNHDQSLVPFASRISHLVETLEWPVDYRIWSDWFSGNDSDGSDSM
jgi:hypothetical protein